MFCFYLFYQQAEEKVKHSEISGRIRFVVSAVNCVVSTTNISRPQRWQNCGRVSGSTTVEYVQLHDIRQLEYKMSVVYT